MKAKYTRNKNVNSSQILDEIRRFLTPTSSEYLTEKIRNRFLRYNWTLY
jgi:hypothetical protein